MPPSWQYIPPFSSSRLLGSSILRRQEKILNPILLHQYSPQRNREGRTERNRKQEKVSPASLTIQKNTTTITFLVRPLNWNIKYCYFTLLWRVGGSCCGLVGQCPGKGPPETRPWVVCVSICVHMSVCVLGNHSRRSPIIRLSEGAVGRNWRRGPQLSQGLAGGPLWLIALYQRRHTYIHRRTLRHPHDPAWHPIRWAQKEAWIHRKHRHRKKLFNCSTTIVQHPKSKALW